jgi:hypothetical protein
MRPGRIVEDMGSRSLVGRLIEVSVDFGEPVAHAAHAFTDYLERAVRKIQHQRPLSAIKLAGVNSVNQDEVTAGNSAPMRWPGPRNVSLGR